MDEEDEQNTSRPRLYCYPELEPLNKIIVDELSDENLLILCLQKDDMKVAFVWIGSQVASEVYITSFSWYN